MEKSAQLQKSIRTSVAFAENLLRGKPTGHSIVSTKPDEWKAIDPQGRIVSCLRDVDATSKSGSMRTDWTVVKSNDQGGVNVKPILEIGNDRYLVFTFIPRPAMNQWLLEYPAGGVLAGESPLEAGRRELEEETGFKAGRMQVIMPVMSQAAYRLDRSDIVLEATNLSEGKRKLDFEEKLIEVYVLPEAYVKELLGSGKITDFRTYAITADHFLFRT